MSLPTGFHFSDSATDAGDPADALPLHIVDAARHPAWLETQPAFVQGWLAAQGFSAAMHSVATWPDAQGELAGAVLGVGDAHDPMSYAHAPFALPMRSWRVEGLDDPVALDALHVGWGLGSYRFDRYRAPPRAPAQLLVSGRGQDQRRNAAIALVAACVRVRDLVNTPAEHMGPDQLESVVCELAQRFDAEVAAISGDDLLAQNFPAIHAVGRASRRAPRLLVLRKGDPSQPHLAIVGKGVCFDTGGLDLKPADGMRNMKKDMGGAAHAIALAELLMARELPVRITLLVAAVDNAVGPNAFRPGDVIATRSGISVEIDNTDAEGRVVLGDALVYAGEQSPDLILDFATLTGAARIALGPDLPALYSHDDALAEAWLAAGIQHRDPLWRMPLHRPYWRYLSSTIADIANSGPSKMAGSITAALYLERFVPAGVPWAHLDVYSWNDADRPGRPAGGEAQGLRAAFAMLEGWSTQRQ